MGFKARNLERTLLRDNPLWLLILRNDPAALTNQVDEFELQYRKLMVLEEHCKGFCYALCLFFFPLGLFSLAGVMPRVRCREMKIILGVLLVLDIGCIATVIAVKFYGFLVMDGTSFFLLV